MTGPDVVVLARELPEYLVLVWRAVCRPRRPLVFDATNALGEASPHEAGWRIVQVGRPLS